MSDLQETLKQLGDDVPRITQEMNHLVQQGAEAQHSADELLKAFEQAEGEARDVFHQIEQMLAELKKDAAQHLAELNHDLADVEKGLDEVKTLEHARDELKHGVDAAGHAMSSFQSKLQEGSEDLTHAHDEFKNALDEVKHGVEEGHSLLKDAHEAMHDAGEALQNKITEHKNSLSDLIENTFHNTMTQHLQDTEQKVGEFLTQAQSLGETFHNGAEDILNNVVKAKSHEIMDAMKEKIEDELKSLMDKATDEICNAIQGLADKVTGAKDASQGHRDAMKPLFEKLDAFKKPFDDAIEAVKGACETVGISFG
jgi:chromosome segregation ATPase